MSIIDDLAAQKNAITATADGYIATTTNANATALAQMQALDAGLADLAAAIVAERAKLAPAMAALTTLNLMPALTLPGAQ